MTELKRVKQYFAKIQHTEDGPGQRNTTVNIEAATRVLKADLVSCLMYVRPEPAR
jgi:exosome complex protein LRP1